MKAWIFSDLHLDVNAATPFALPAARPAHDLVVIAGDLCVDMAEAIRWIAVQGLNRKPVVYVAGNHEFYGRDRQEGLARGRAAAADHPNIHVLECDRVDLAGLRVLGTTLWTDYRLYGDQADAMALAERMLSDHRLIRHGARAWTAADAGAEHARSRAWIEAELATPFPGPTLVVTHHAPSPGSVTARFRDHPLSPAFASDLSALAAKATAWIHGHTHGATDHVLAGCRIIANPRGYVPRERTGFRQDLVVSIG